MPILQVIKFTSIVFGIMLAYIISMKTKTNKEELVMPSPISNYAKRWNRNPLNNFAVACYDCNTLEELQDTAYVDKTDCKTWDLCEREWKEAIQAAIDEKLSDITDEDV